MNYFCSWRKKLALQFREGRDKGTRLNVSLIFFCLIFFSENFSFFFLGNFFLRFLSFCDRCLPSVSLGPWFESQALPDLWSPRVWFTFRNLKVYWVLFFSREVIGGKIVGGKKTKI